MYNTELWCSIASSVCKVCLKKTSSFSLSIEIFFFSITANKKLLYLALTVEESCFEKYTQIHIAKVGWTRSTKLKLDNRVLVQQRQFITWTEHFFCLRLRLHIWFTLSLFPDFFCIHKWYIVLHTDSVINEGHYMSTLSKAGFRFAHYGLPDIQVCNNTNVLN